MTDTSDEIDSIKAQINSIEAAISDVKDDLDAMESHEPTLNTKREAFEYFVTEHPNLSPADGEWYAYYDCTGAMPDDSNIGSGQSDAADYLGERGYRVSVELLEESVKDNHDMLLLLSVSED